GRRAVALQGVARVTLKNFPQTSPYLKSKFEVIPQTWRQSAEADGVKRALLHAVRDAAALFDTEAPLKQLTRSVQEPAVLADVLAYMLDAPVDWKQDVLLTIDPMTRAEKVLGQLGRVREAVAAQKSIESRVRSELKDAEREAILRRQLKAIQEELGEGDGDDVSRLKAKLSERSLPEEVQNAVDRELGRLARMQNGSPERNTAVDWLEWIADLPWGKQSSRDIELNRVEAELDRTHHGLDEVKRQVVEHLAVRKLAGHGRADVLLLVGPPGVGKTSIAQAVADATDRKLVRVALGGVRDEAELRGHRRTYVGARPGRIIEGFRRAGTTDPVVLLDEVDKLGRGWQGDPSAALLEILDPEQNHAFTDHYLEVPFDLSKSLFIATANDLSQVSAPLRDRMEIIEIEGYTPDEKVSIAKDHVLKKLAENVGLTEDDVVFDDEVIEQAIAGWTKEAGVRQLQRVLGKIFRAAAVKKAKAQLEQPLAVRSDELKAYLGKRRFFRETHEVGLRPGVATGLAWTPVGGDVLYIEATAVPGQGKLVLTGQLGDVMKESAQAALTYVRSQAASLGIDDDVFKMTDFHVHIPAGATPKDGPSAGVTMFTALASLLSNRPVFEDVAMTGEVTLRGRVLPVGGIKAKVLAAYAHGLRRVILPARNEADLDDIPAAIRDEMVFVPVTHVDEVSTAALAPRAPVSTPSPASPQKADEPMLATA
ncbi:MAG: endopeptidase La, partial [Myxococcota bacterium]